MTDTTRVQHHSPSSPVKSPFLVVPRPCPPEVAALLTDEIRLEMLQLLSNLRGVDQKTAQNNLLKILQEGVKPGDRVLTLDHYDAIASRKKLFRDQFSQLGRGGSGMVFATELHETGEEVAVKVIQDDDAELTIRALQESNVGIHARAINGVNSTRIAFRSPHIDGLSPAGGNIMLVMDRIIGNSLSTRINDMRGEPWKQRARPLLPPFISACQAMQQMHDQGIIHRDLKPDNIMIPSQTPQSGVIIDWGLAKQVSPTQPIRVTTIYDHQQVSSHVRTLQKHPNNLFSGVSHLGTVRGTPHYFSPEHLSGSASKESDVFSMGLVLIEILSGRPLFDGEVLLSIMFDLKDHEKGDPSLFTKAAGMMGDECWKQAESAIRASMASPTSLRCTMSKLASHAQIILDQV